MPQAFQINLTVSQLTQSVRALKQVGDQYKSIADLSKQIKGSGFGGGTGSGAATAAGTPSGAALMRQQAADLRAQAGLIRAQASLDRAQAGPGGRQSVAGALNTFVRSTRFGAGGVQPLVGRGVDVGAALLRQGGHSAAAGLVSKLAGPITLGVTLVATGLKYLWEELQGASQHIHGISASAGSSGGSSGQVAYLSAMGMPAGSLAAIAAQFRETQRNDGYAMAQSQRLGIAMPAPHQLGGVNQNNLTNLTAALVAIRKLGTEEEKLQAMRIFHLEEFTHLLKISDNVMGQMAVDAKFAQMTITPHAQKVSADFEAGKGRLGANLQTAKDALALPAMEKLADAMNAAATGIAAFGPAINFWAPKLEMIRDPLGSISKAISDWLIGVTGMDKGAADQVEATKDLTKEMRALRGFGGGPRAAGAMPGGLRGYAFDSARTSTAISMGAFSLNSGI